MNLQLFIRPFEFVALHAIILKRGKYSRGDDSGFAESNLHSRKISIIFENNEKGLHLIMYVLGADGQCSIYR